MHVGLIISVLLHVAILGWAVITIQTQRDMRVAEPEPVAVDLLTPSEVTKVRQGVRTAKQMDAEAKETPKPSEVPRKEAPKPTPVATPKPEPPPEPPKEEVKEAPKPEPPKPEPPKEVAKVEPPKLPEPAKDPIAEKLAAERPDPALEQAKKLEEERREEARKAEELQKAEEQRKAEEQKRLEEQKKQEEARKLAELKKKKEDDEKKRKAAEAKKKADDEKKRKEAEARKSKSFDDQMREMQALLNKVPDKGAPLPNTPQEEPSKNKGPVLGAKEGRDNRLSASEIAILGQIIRSCVQSKWNILGGGETAQNTEVKMRLRFNPDGRLAAEPQVTNQQNTPYFLAASESAKRAVQQCEPFPLPAPKYEFWRDMILTFRPGDMF